MRIAGCGDVVMISLLVVFHRAWQDSYFILLYLLVIIVREALLFSRRIAFLVTGYLFFCSLRQMTVLAICGKIPTPSPPRPRRRASNVAGHESSGVSLLSPIWPASWPSLFAKRALSSKKKREELHQPSGLHRRHHSLQLRGGLITTDLDGRMLLLNRHRRGVGNPPSLWLICAAKKLQELNEDFWLPGQYENSERLSLRKEMTSARLSGDLRAIWAVRYSPAAFARLATRTATFFNFQDLTDLRRLEQEVGN